MFRCVTMILLAFAVLLGSGHASSWSHDHADSGDHVLVMAHADVHGQMIGQEEPSDTADVKDNVAGQHSHPSGVAIAVTPYNFGGANVGSLPTIAPARMLASFSQAPPTEPPSS